MATQTGRTRTITGYISDLLEYPRWIIEHDVDFTDCKYGGHFNVFIDTCAHCRFGPGCRWLDRYQARSPEEPGIDELTEALESAVAYLRETCTHDHECDCETCLWLRDARHFKRAHLKATCDSYSRVSGSS